MLVDFLAKLLPLNQTDIACFPSECDTSISIYIYNIHCWVLPPSVAKLMRRKLSQAPR